MLVQLISVASYCTKTCPVIYQTLCGEKCVWYYLAHHSEDPRKECAFWRSSFHPAFGKSFLPLCCATSKLQISSDWQFASTLLSYWLYKM